MNGYFEWKLFVDHEKNNLLWEGKFPIETVHQPLLSDICPRLYRIPLSPTILYMATLLCHENTSFQNAYFPIAKRELALSNSHHKDPTCTSNIIYYCLLNLSVIEPFVKSKFICQPLIPSN